MFQILKENDFEIFPDFFCSRLSKTGELWLNRLFLILKNKEIFFMLIFFSFFKGIFLDFFVIFSEVITFKIKFGLLEEGKKIVH